MLFTLIIAGIVVYFLFPRDLSTTCVRVVVVECRCWSSVGVGSHCCPARFADGGLRNVSGHINSQGWVDSLNMTIQVGMAWRG
jgi:hypothetical protein